MYVPMYVHAWIQPPESRHSQEAPLSSHHCAWSRDLPEQYCNTASVTQWQLVIDRADDEFILGDSSLPFQQISSAGQGREVGAGNKVHIICTQ